MSRTVTEMRLQDEALDQLMAEKTRRERRIIVEDLKLEHVGEEEQRNRLRHYFEAELNLHIPWEENG